LQAHPYHHRASLTQEIVIPAIEVDEATGIAAVGDQVFELSVGDMISLCNEEGTFFLGRIRSILDSPATTTLTPLVTQYQVWYFETDSTLAKIWDFHTTWHAMILKNNSSATATISLEHCLTVKFKLTRS
jgi:hypothetical protein